LVTIRPFAREKKRFAQKFTDGRTDRRRTPRDCISSWNELTNHSKIQNTYEINRAMLPHMRIRNRYINLPVKSKKETVPFRKPRASTNR